MKPRKPSKEALAILASIERQKLDAVELSYLLAALNQRAIDAADRLFTHLSDSPVKRNPVSAMRQRIFDLAYLKGETSKMCDGAAAALNRKRGGRWL